MFQAALKSDYDWYMGLDADIVLKPDWLTIIKARIEEIQDREDVFKFTCFLRDKFLPQPVDRGNHVYNARFTKLALEALKKNILLSRLGPLAQLAGLQRGFYLKPETAIRTRLLKEHGIQNATFDDVIGWHGYEQYFVHIFHRFAVRANRNPEYEEKYDFLAPSAKSALELREDRDWYVANLGWWYGKKRKFYRIDARNTGRYRNFLQKEDVVEKPPFLRKLEDVIKALSKESSSI